MRYSRERQQWVLTRLSRRTSRCPELVVKSKRRSSQILGIVRAPRLTRELKAPQSTLGIKLSFGTVSVDVTLAPALQALANGNNKLHA